MITKIQSYNSNSNYKPNFQAVIAKEALVTVKRRGEVLPVNVGKNFFADAKEIFFELFPKLDPEYDKFVKTQTLKSDKKPI